MCGIRSTYIDVLQQDEKYHMESKLHSQKHMRNIQTYVYVCMYPATYIQEWDNEVDTPDSSDFEGVDQPYAPELDEGDCCVCRVGGFLVSCDGGCNRDFCMGCSGIGNPALLPRGPWVCGDCQRERSGALGGNSLRTASRARNSGHRNGESAGGSRSRREDVVVLDDDDDDDDDGDFMADDSDILEDDKVTNTRRRGGRLMLTRRSGPVGRGPVRSTNSEASSSSAGTRGAIPAARRDDSSVDMPNRLNFGGAAAGTSNNSLSGRFRAVASSGLNLGRGDSTAITSRPARQDDNSTNIGNRESNQSQDTRVAQVRRMPIFPRVDTHMYTHHLRMHTCMRTKPDTLGERVRCMSVTRRVLE
jgi:hypothetical protein